MNDIHTRLACLDLAEFVLEEECARIPGVDLSSSARALSLATAIQDAIDAWQIAQAGEPDEAPS
jgi:hypothetical protein